MKNSLSRRAMITSGAVMPFAFDAAAVTTPGPPPYTLSINIEIMFPRTMPRPERMKVVAAQGFKAYSFWNTTEEEQDAMLKVQEQTGLKCASITGPGRTGSSTGLTAPGMEKDYLEDIAAKVKMASRFGGPQPIIFVGRNQPSVAWEQQRSQIVSGLKKAGDIAAERGITLVVEPLSSADGQTRMALDTVALAFPAIEEVGHPRVKICFDMYHLQLMEGNITNHLRQGITKGLIGLVQMGEVPGRLEPGTGEIDYAYMMRILRQLNYKGYFDTEMGTSTTPETAMQLARKMSLEN
jgi:hydroxypyruvate isomerase